MADVFLLTKSEQKYFTDLSTAFIKAVKEEGIHSDNLELTEEQLQRIAKKLPYSSKNAIKKWGAVMSRPYFMLMVVETYKPAPPKHGSEPLADDEFFLRGIAAEKRYTVYTEWHCLKSDNLDPIRKTPLADQIEKDSAAYRLINDKRETFDGDAEAMAAIRDALGITEYSYIPIGLYGSIITVISACREYINLPHGPSRSQGGQITIETSLQVLPASPQPLVGLFLPDDHSKTFTGAVLRSFSTARTKGAANQSQDALIIDGVTVKIDLSKDAKKTKKIGVGEDKLLQYGVSAFTKNNSANEKRPTLRIFGDTKAFARHCIKEPERGIDPRKMNTPAEQKKENQRAEKALFNFINKLNKNIVGLQVPISWSESIKGKITAFDSVVFLSRGRVTKDVIMLEFSQTAAEYMVKLPMSEVHPALYAIDDKKPNAYAMGKKFVYHFCVENNIIRNTERILKVETLLEETSFPTQETIKAKRWSWERVVKEPFEEALDELYQKGLLKDWKYCFSGMKPLSDEQAANISKYEQFTSLYVYFELTGYESHETRRKFIMEKHEAEQAALKCRKKSKESSKALKSNA